MRDVFKKIITDFHEKEMPPTLPRDVRIPVNSGKIVSVIGVRRSGKTSLLYHVIEKLRETVPPTDIIYINFEDDRLFPLELKHLNELMEAYYELHPEKSEKKVYVFFDEIQNIEHWEKFVRRIYDSLHVEIFITGYSSKLLSSEIATALRGRTITYELFPFSFSEYLRFRKIGVNIHSSKSVSYITNAFDDYITHGGFPETVGALPDISFKNLAVDETFERVFLCRGQRLKIHLRCVPLTRLRFRKIGVNIHSSKSVSYITNAFDDYITHGGFPETVGALPERTYPVQDTQGLRRLDHLSRHYRTTRHQESCVDETSGQILFFEHGYQCQHDQTLQRLQIPGV